MPIKLTEKDAKTIHDRVDRARRYTEREVCPNLRRARELYRGQHWPGMNNATDRARIVCNILFPAVETKVANLAFNYPDFTLKPMNREGQAHSDVARHVIAYDWRQMDAQDEAKRALRDRETYGVGVNYVYWLFETEPVEGEAGTCVEGGRPVEAMEPTDTTPDLVLPEPIFAEQMLRVRTDRPAVKRLSPFQFFVDLECDAKLENAEFCGFAEVRAVEDVKADKRYRNTRQLKGTAKGLRPYLDEETRDLDDSQCPDDCKRVLLFHYFEKRRKLHAVYCDEHTKPLLVEEWTWEGDWYPFVVNRCPDDEDCFWPTPPLLRVEHQQHEVNEARTQHSNWRAQAVPKFQTRGSMDPVKRQRFRCASAGEVLEEMGDPIEAINIPPVQREVLEAGQMAMADLQFLMGLNAYETANAPTKRMTEGESEAVRLSGGSRAVADRQAFEMFCSELARRVLALEMQYSVRSRELPIFDQEENVSGFRDYTREEIRGEYLVEVAVGSTTAPKSDDVLEGIGFLLQSLPAFIQAMQTAQMMGLDLREVLPELLKAALPDARHLQTALLKQVSQPMMPPMMAQPAEMAGPPPNVEGVMPEETGGGLAATGTPEEEALLAMLAGGG
jgi:hypothetical protein